MFGWVEDIDILNDFRHSIYVLVKCAIYTNLQYKQIPQSIDAKLNNFNPGQQESERRKTFTPRILINREQNNLGKTDKQLTIAPAVQIAVAFAYKRRTCRHPLSARQKTSKRKSNLLDKAFLNNPQTY